MMIALLVMLALAPVAAIIAYIYKQDKFEREPNRLLLYAFILGLLSVVPAFAGSYFGNAITGFNVSLNPFQTLLHAFVVIAFAEELAKFIFLRGIFYPNKNFDEPLDGIVYSVIISMGFAAFENILYVVEGGIKVGILRMLTAVPAHAAFGVLMGYYVGLAKFDKKNSILLLFKSLAYTILAHGLYDFFLMQQNIPFMTLTAFVVLAISLRVSYLAIKANQKDSPFKNPPPTTTPPQPAITETLPPNYNTVNQPLNTYNELINNTVTESLPNDNTTWQQLFDENLPSQKLPNKDENL